MTTAEQLTVEDEMMLQRIDMLESEDELQQSFAKDRDLDKVKELLVALKNLLKLQLQQALTSLVSKKAKEQKRRQPRR